MSGKNVRGENHHDLLAGEAGRETGKAATGVCYTHGHETGYWIWNRGANGEDLQLGYLFPFRK